jgi:transcriptional regulator of heat shock response
LADEGYLYKSHISSGRIPTDKSYRLFVDRILERGLSYHFDFDDLFNDNIDNIHFFIRSLTKHISDMTKSFVMGYLVEDDFFWKDGLLEVIKEPEFNDRDYLLDFVNFLERLENDIDRLIEFKNNSGINVFIGEENPFPKAEKFAVIVSSCNLPKNGRSKKSIISVLGPKRMSYDRNIGLMISLLKELNKLEHG